MRLPVVALAVTLLVGVTAVAQAQPRDERVLAAELLVMRGDLRRLDNPAAPALEHEGLRQRLAGALSPLHLMIRRAGTDDEGAVQSLRRALAANDLAAFGRGLDGLIGRFPLDLSRLLPAEATAERRSWGQALHEDACAGCHDAPDPADSLLPVRRLEDMVRSMPVEEFAARLLNGVRGDTATALASPLGEAEVAALLAYYTR